MKTGAKLRTPSELKCGSCLQTMREIPSGSHPAAALAAGMLNWEAGCEKFNVNLAAHSGTLQELPISDQVPYYLSVPHLASVKHFRVRPASGQIYLTPWPSAEDVRELFSKALRILEQVAPAATCAGRIRDVSQHEALWSRTFASNQPEGAPLKGGVVHETPDSVQVHRSTGFEWGIDRLSAYWLNNEELRSDFMLYLGHSMYSLVLDLYPRRPELPARAPTPPRAQTPPREPHWVPQPSDFNAPTVESFHLLVLLPCGGGEFQLHKVYKELPWAKMAIHKFPTLDVACPRLEAAFRRSKLLQASTCCACNEPLRGYCTALLSQKGGTVPLCIICGSALSALRASPAERSLEFFEDYPEWDGLTVGWDAGGVQERYTLGPDSGDGFLRISRRPAVGSDAGTCSAAPLLGIYTEPAPSYFEYDDPNIRKLGSGRVYKPDCVLVLKGEG